MHEVDGWVVVVGNVVVVVVVVVVGGHWISGDNMHCHLLFGLHSHQNTLELSQHEYSHRSPEVHDVCGMVVDVDVVGGGVADKEQSLSIFIQYPFSGVSWVTMVALSVIGSCIQGPDLR